MQRANGKVKTPGIRRAISSDSSALTHLLRQARFRHLHADWRLPGDWLGDPGFLVYETAQGLIRACLCAAADPPPAAWVRVAAFRHRDDVQTGLARLLPPVQAHLAKHGVTELAWLLGGNMPGRYLSAAGFERINEVIGYRARRWPDVPAAEGVTVRPVAAADFERLVEIESAAFAPLWRHSLSSLQAGFRHASSFDVACIEHAPGAESVVVGFQYSTDAPDRTTHLVRLTVDPAWQGRGVGGTLLAHALREHEGRGVRAVSLNTQADNLPSRRLYERFGFRPTGERYPVWRVEIG